jgi:hypothetical protein
MIGENINTCTKKTASIAHQSAVIKFKKSKKPVLWDLPFADKKTRSYWAVPATGGYIGGYKTGNAMALVFLRHLRNRDQTLPPINDLTLILKAIFKRIQDAGGPLPPLQDPGGAYASLRGQYVGFFNCVTQWLWVAATKHGDSLDELADADLVVTANEGLKFDAVGYFDSLPEDE